MQTYDNETLREINANVDLLGYVSQSISLERRGRDYFGRCPLHVDKTPSFSITPGKNLYYCFSCSRSGGIINFLMDYEGLTFDAAVKKAAALANFDMSKICHSQTVAFLKSVRAANQRREEPPYHHSILSKSQLNKYKHGVASEWLDEGIPQSVLDLFEVRIDEWSNRIVYPVYDIKGNLINIKGRTRYKNFKELKIPKYMNYFEVGVMDYFQGLNKTLQYVKKKNEIIIFESIKSVMKVYGWGYKNCASAEKHNLTDEQVMLLIRLRVNIVFAYDSDVEFSEPKVKENIDKLKRVTNVYAIVDTKKLLGGIKAKNAPVDLGRDIWETLYKEKQKII